MNKEKLNEAIVREAFEQGVDVPETDGLTNNQLVVALDQLVKTHSDDDDVPPPVASDDDDVPPPPVASDDDDVPPPVASDDDDVPPPPVASDDDDVPPPEVVAESQYVVASGKSLTCLKGVLVAGDVIKPEYINGGDESFELLLQQKYIVEG